MHDTCILYRPIDENSFTCDQPSVHCAEVTTVTGHRAMVAHHKEFIGWNFDLGHGFLIGILRRYIDFMLRASIDVDHAFVDADFIAPNGDDALYVALGHVTRIAEDHHIPALNGFPAIDEFVDEEPF